MPEPGTGHRFAQSDLLDEILLEPAELLIEQIIRLMDQADDEIGQHLGRARLEEGAKGFEGYRGRRISGVGAGMGRRGGRDVLFCEAADALVVGPFAAPGGAIAPRARRRT